nr:hypothetical protein [Mycoplasmopsis bovis]
MSSVATVPLLAAKCWQHSRFG